MYDVIIFTDLTESHSGDFPAPVKSLGAYQIASVLRENGYKVIRNNSMWTRYLLCFLIGSFLMGHIYG